jgi:protein-S-isoprenylcysteine O-methyltransferase Ste14
MAIAAARPYFNSHPPFLVLWILTWVLAAGVEHVNPTRRRREGASARDRGSYALFFACLTPGIVVLAFSFKLAPGARIEPSVVSLLIGEAVFLVGIGLRLWSIRTLGEYFTVTVQTEPHQRVIESGPYRFVRHPSYSAIALYAIGAGLIVGNWLGLAGMVVLTLVPLAYRIHIEEQALTADLGDTYRSYAARHKRLIPKLW